MLTLMMTLLLVGVPQTAKSVRVYVFTAPAVDGFVDVDMKRREASVRDLQGALAKKKGIAIAESAESADLTLEVVTSAELPSTTSGTTTSAGIFGPRFETEVKKLPKLATMLRVRGTEYSKEFALQDEMFWKTLASRIGDQIDQWVKDNAAQLAVRK